MTILKERVNLNDYMHTRYKIQETLFMETDVN